MLRVTEINSTHSCSTAARQARHFSDDAVGTVYTRQKLLDLGHKLQDSLAVESSEHEDEPRQELVVHFGSEGDAAPTGPGECPD